MTAADRVVIAVTTGPHAPIRGCHIAALRAVAFSSGRLRHDAYPEVMPVLCELCFVEERVTRAGTGRCTWHLIQAGLDLLDILDIRPDAEL